MRATIQLVLVILFANLSLAQQGINYKAIIKDGGGNIVANQSITIQFQILQGAGMSLQYQETHNPMTDTNGIIVVNIGEGLVDSGVFVDIDWGADDYYLNVQIDTGSGLTDMGTSQFTAVPYSLYSRVVEDFQFYYADMDQDGYGDKWNVVFSNIAPNGFINNQDDCDDKDASIYPGAPEICGDGIDQDCDQDIDETCGSSQILSARNSVDGTVSIPIEDVYVTYVYFDSWFTVQSEEEGPALTIYVPEFGFNLNPGDKASFTITELSTNNGVHQATGISNLMVLSSDNDIIKLIQDVSNSSDLNSDVQNYESELISVTGTIVGTFQLAGGNLQVAQFETEGITADSGLTIRLPSFIAETIGDGCEITVNATPLGLFNDAAQILAFFPQEINIISCPN